MGSKVFSEIKFWFIGLCRIGFVCSLLESFCFFVDDGRCFIFVGLGSG